MNSETLTTSRRRVPARALVFLFTGGCWLAFVIYFMISKVVLRETPLGAIAKFLDKLPTAVGNPVFIFLWIVFLLGWAALVGIGARKLLRWRSSK
jgi:hypothetical protein